MLALSYCTHIIMRLLALSPAALAVAVVLQLLSPGNAYAAADKVRISNFSDMTTPLWITGDPAIITTNLVCVYHLNFRTYGITATGNGPGFLLKSGAYTVAYTVTWNDGGAANPGGGTTAPMVSGVKLTNRQNARLASDVPTNSTDCNVGASPTAKLTVTISATAMDAARDGTFTGVLTLVLSVS